MYFFSQKLGLLGKKLRKKPGGSSAPPGGEAAAPIECNRAPWLNNPNP
jgi:hypothetical protein